MDIATYQVTYLGCDGKRKIFGKNFSFVDAGKWAMNIIKVGCRMVEVTLDDNFINEDV